MAFGLYKETRTPTGEPQLILVEQGVGHRITDPQAFEQATGQRLTNLPQANVNTMSSDISFAEARQRGYLEPILGSQFASPTVEYVNWAGTQDIPQMAGFYPRGTTASLQRQAGEIEARRLNLSAPQAGAPTEFQRYFQEQRSLGRSQEDILRNNPFIARTLPQQSPQSSQRERTNFWNIETGQFEGQLPQSAEQALNVIQEQIVNNPVNPDVEISSQMTQQFLTQAQQELGPYYQQLFQQAQADLQRGLEQLGEDVATSERRLEGQYRQQLGNVQEQMASRGLTFSTRRGEAEQTIAQQTQAAIEAGRREAERRAFELGTEAERRIGTTNLPSQASFSALPPVPALSGSRGFNYSPGTRSLFTPVGGTVGTLQQERLAAERKRQAELTGAERQLRGLYTR